MARKRLPRQFYLSQDVVALSQSLLGKFLVTEIDGQRTAGMIIETEAYNGVSDKASHAYNHRRTARTETMFAKGGVAYVYLCYGLHHLFNIVTAPENDPQAVLIRAILPTDNIPLMLKRRNMLRLNARFTAGPGTLSQALGITTRLSGIPLTGAPVWVEDRAVHISPQDILASPRVGIDYAQEHRDLPWRFRISKSGYENYKTSC